MAIPWKTIKFLVLSSSIRKRKNQKMKRIEFLLVLLFFADRYHITQSMEQEVNAAENFPYELQQLIATFISDNVSGNADGYYFAMVPKPLEQREDKEKSNTTLKPHEAKICTKDLLYPVNLNRCNVVFANKKNNDRIFSIQCWKQEDRASELYVGSANYTTYRLNDDDAKNRVITSNSGLLQNVFFDGINDQGFMLIGGHIWAIKKKEVFHKSDYRYFFIRMDEDTKALYKKNIYDTVRISKELRGSVNNKKYLSEPIQGALVALALCKTKNRYVLVDDKSTIIFEIPDNFEELEKKDWNPPIAAYVNNSENVVIKKIAFITPETLLAVSESGVLYIDLPR
jgi:hypothetical protein